VLRAQQELDRLPNQALIPAAGHNALQQVMRHRDAGKELPGEPPC